MPNENGNCLLRELQCLLSKRTCPFPFPSWPFLGPLYPPCNLQGPALCVENIGKFNCLPFVPSDQIQRGPMWGGSQMVSPWLTTNQQAQVKCSWVRRMRMLAQCSVCMCVYVCYSLCISTVYIVYCILYIWLSARVKFPTKYGLVLLDVNLLGAHHYTVRHPTVSRQV